MEEHNDKEGNMKFLGKEMLGVMQFAPWEKEIVERDLCALEGIVTLLVNGEEPIHAETTVPLMSYVIMLSVRNTH